MGIVTVTVRDSVSGAAILGAKWTHTGTRYSPLYGYADGAGRFSFVTVTDEMFELYLEKEGYVLFSAIQTPRFEDYSINISLTRLPPDPGTPPPPGEQVIGTVGTSCDLLQKGMFGRTWYSYRNRYTGWHWAWDSEYEDAQYSAVGNTGCFAPPPPPPRTIDDVSKEVSMLGSTVEDVAKRVAENELGLEQEQQERQKEQGVISGLIDRITGALDGAKKDIFGAFQRIDQEAAERKKDILGIWDRLEGWLVERMVRILLTALNNEAKNSRGKT